MDFQYFLFLIVNVSIFGFVIIIYYLSVKRNEKMLELLKSYFNGYIKKSLFSPSFVGEHKGLKFTISIHLGSESTPPSIKIAIKKSSYFSLKIYRESILSSFGKKLGLLHELKVGDNLFDKEFLIFSDKPHRAQIYLSSTIIKDNIKQIFENGFNVFKINHKGILISKPTYNLEKDLIAKNIIEIVNKLIILAEGL